MNLTIFQIHPSSHFIVIHSWCNDIALGPHNIGTTAILLCDGNDDISLLGSIIGIFFGHFVGTDSEQACFLLQVFLVCCSPVSPLQCQTQFLFITQSHSLCWSYSFLLWKWQQLPVWVWLIDSFPRNHLTHMVTSVPESLCLFAPSIWHRRNYKMAASIYHRELCHGLRQSKLHKLYLSFQSVSRIILR